MKLVIWWLSLMIVLPLIYLFCWKKSWRLPVGVVILVVLGISFFVPEEIINSLVNRKIKKEWHNSAHQEKQIAEQLTTLRKKDFSSPPSSEKSEKIALEKEIAELNEWMLENKNTPKPNDNPFESYIKERIRDEKIQLYIQKWSEKKPVPPLLFRGKELTQGLEKLSKDKEEHEIKGRKYKKYSVVIIDLKDFTQIEPVQKEIVKLVKKEKEYTSIPLLWFKNIDQVKKGSELEKFLLDLLTNREKYEVWKYKEEKYNFFNFVVVASEIDTQTLSPVLQTKLNLYEPFLDKYQLIIIGITVVGEIILFFILIRISRKNKNIIKLK
ncbi:MAG: hypothetical protein I3270_01440 [Candidatus Moeniiplasma glomeromycotorum]|nr:hypothetical protein [Candidatus Moeniiplasma glomeromycotorum]MCE8162372.1 hypothetical protein [Candidatus Moeniiplasma glomeromycotorum]MCE8166296.1 hypothetical protein [Candidatus Moeniiplasma glomeromycotorum]MCE8166778.1 hypothetical protein [Candidatus Moeniiplasma glomeromycotorum]